MSSDALEFAKKNPTLTSLYMENIILKNKIKDITRIIKENEKKIDFLEKNRMNEGI